MIRSLHVKMVMIMVLLVASLMIVAGVFLINSVGQFYLNDFYNQMENIFERDKAFFRDLTVETSIEEDAVNGIQEVLSANMGALGVDGHNRNFFILDGETGAVLAGSNDDMINDLELTDNVFIALKDGNTVGSDNNVTSSYMDIAIPIKRGGESYIVYILDNKQTVQELSGEMFVLIIEAMGFGLLISVLLSFLLSKTLIIPVQQLTQSAKKIARGDFDEMISVDSQDEIGVLTNTFQSMANQLKNTIQEVENERNKLDTLFLHMTDGVVAFNQNGHLIHANPAVERMLDRKMPLNGTIEYKHIFGNSIALDSILSVDDGFLQEEMMQGEQSLHLLFAPFSREEQAGVLVVIHDVTQQVKTEQMRREFVANVSHELRTPLTNIRSYAETLADAGDLPEDMKQDFLKVILNESDRMTHIVKDLLTLSKLDSESENLNITQFSFERMLSDVYDAVKMEAKRRKHRLVLDIKNTLPYILADRDRLLQVMMNIVSNAIKYTPDNGEITIETGALHEYVWVEVTDNGIGIPNEDRERIFDRFYRVDKARSRESGGTGLGLSIAKEIVDRHEGRLLLVDSKNKGTTVRLELKVEGPAYEE